jgi:hypothetical protein
MEQIVTYVKDPAWWFSAFFIAIIASVIAGFTKDRIERGLASLFVWARAYQKERAERRQAVIDALAHNETFLIISMIRGLAFTGIFFGAVLLFVLSPMWIELQKTVCETIVASVDPTCHGNPRVVALLAFVGFGVLAMVVGFTGGVVMNLTMKGYGAYRKAHDLPRIM